MGLAKSAFKKSTRMLIDLDSTVEATATCKYSSFILIVATTDFHSSAEDLGENTYTSSLVHRLSIQR